MNADDYANGRLYVEESDRAVSWLPMVTSWQERRQALFKRRR